MINVVHREKLGDDGIEGDENNWVIHNDRENMMELWQTMKSFDWSHLPDPGGWLDQNQSITRDMFTLQWLYTVIKAQYEANVAANGQP